MAGDRIRDIEKIQELIHMTDSVSQLAAALPDSSIKSGNESADSIEELNERIDELSRLPDNFNEHFIERGWMCYENLNVPVAIEAVKLANEGDMEGAEKILVDYYDEETISHQLNVLKQVEGFTGKDFIDPNEAKRSQSRWELARKALEDYVAGRYHASVPVVLALADGMVQQAHINATGEGGNLSAENVNHEAWNSIAGHSTGLEQLKDVIMKRRLKTRTAEIDIPYRHGIMHGMDLCYDNKLVAAKSWAFLFAAGEWAQKAQSDELAPPEQDGQDTTLRGVIEMMRETEQKKKKQKEWEARDPIIGETVPASGSMDEYQEGTPEHALVYHLQKWREGRYDLLASFFQQPNGAAEEIDIVNGNFKHNDLKSFNLIEIQEKSLARADIVVETCVDSLRGEVTEEKEVTLIRARDDGSPAMSKDDGKWTLPTWQTLI